MEVINKQSITKLTQNINSVNFILKQSAAGAINKHVTCRNWLIGYYIVNYEQKGNDRAKYGEKLLQTLAEKLSDKSLSYTNLKLCRQFFLMYSRLFDEVKCFLESYLSIRQSPIAQLQLPENNVIEIGQSVIGEFEDEEVKVPEADLFNKLSFTHFVQLLPIEDNLERAFYELECIKGIWSVRELKRQIQSHYFERCALSKDKQALKEKINGNAAKTNLQELIKSPFTFEFLGLNAKDVVEESDLESAIIDNLKDFLIELGNGFCFEARQKRILIDDKYYFCDLLFYHRILHCGVLIELKSDELNYADIAQLNMYLAYYRKNLMNEGDNLPVGILLCTKAGKEMVEYATVGIDENLFVSQYMLALPSKEELRNWLKEELRK